MKRSQIMLLSIIFTAVIGTFAIINLDTCPEQGCHPIDSQLTDFQRFMVEGVVDNEAGFFDTKFIPTQRP